MNLASYLPVWTFSNTKKLIEDIRKRKTMSTFGADNGLIDINEEGISSNVTVYKDDVIEFYLVFLSVANGNSVLSRQTLDEFKDAIMKYIGKEAYGYSYINSLNLSVQDHHFNSIMFSGDKKFYEFLTLVNKHGHITID